MFPAWLLVFCNGISDRWTTEYLIHDCHYCPVSVGNGSTNIHWNVIRIEAVMFTVFIWIVVFFLLVCYSSYCILCVRFCKYFFLASQYSASRILACLYTFAIINEEGIRQPCWPALHQSVGMVTVENVQIIGKNIHPHDAQFQDTKLCTRFIVNVFRFWHLRNYTLLYALNICSNL